jgi:DNA-binding HxlR family transcriptional regulator
MPTVSIAARHGIHGKCIARCPCREMLDLLANKWSASIIAALEAGPQRFGQLRGCLQGVSQKVLTHNLRRLEQFGLVTRTVYPALPLRVEYELTPLGRAAAVPLDQLRTWVADNLTNPAVERNKTAAQRWRPTCQPNPASPRESR